MSPNDTVALAQRIAEEEIGGPPTRCIGHKADRYNAAYNAVVKTIAALSTQELNAKEGEAQADRDRRMYEQGQRDERAGEPEAFQ